MTSHYELWSNSGPNGEFEKTEAKLGINSYTATNLTPAKIYKFKARAVNCCGRSPFTKELIVTVFRAADKPTLPCPRAACENESVLFKWNQPRTYGSAITGLSLTVLDNNNVAQQYDPCSYASALSCLITTRSLRNPPFNL
jgi:hypothetical protein